MKWYLSLIKENQPILISRFKGGEIMDKRERILELVKEDVLSVEEGLDLLESLSKQEAKEKTETQDPVETEKIQDSSEEEENKEPSEAKKMRADELENIANEINQYSVMIDGLNEKILVINTERIEREDELNRLLALQNDEYLAKKKELEDRIIQLNKDMNELSILDEEANTKQLEALSQDLSQSLEALYLLEKTSASDEEIEALEQKIEQLREKSENLAQEKNKKMKEMHSLKMKQWTTKAKQFSDNIDIPKEWRAGATKTIDKAGELIDESSQTITEVLSEAAQKVKESFQNLEWEDMKIDLSMKEKAAFSHEWVFEETTASIFRF